MFSSEINTLKTIVTFIQVISFDFCSFYDGYEDWFQIVDEMFNNAVVMQLMLVACGLGLWS